MAPQPKKWAWWYSDNDERYLGPCETRDEAIVMGRKEYGNDSFNILEATKGKLRSFIANNLEDWFDGSNTDACDPDGDLISSEITQVKWDDLMRRLDAAAEEWITAHNLDEYCWSFEETRNREEIPAIEDEAEA